MAVLATIKSIFRSIRIVRDVCVVLIPVLCIYNLNKLFIDKFYSMLLAWLDSSVRLLACVNVIYLCCTVINKTVCSSFEGINSIDKHILLSLCTLLNITICNASQHTFNLFFALIHSFVQFSHFEEMMPQCVVFIQYHSDVHTCIIYMYIHVYIIMSKD